MAINFSFLVEKIKNNSALIIIFLIGFLSRLWLSHHDPFLQDWDERFHALVAQNMLMHPLQPMLVGNPVVGYKVSDWSSNHIWLHKPPLFLWQIALSLKCFGCHEWAIRLPSAIMSSLMILLVYRISILFTKNRLTALFSATLLCFSHFQWQLISGRQCTDHNDVAFGFYLLASIWAYVEYLHRSHWKWIYVIGILAGGAILNKWLTGLLIYAAWGTKLIFDFYQNRNYKSVIPFLISLTVCALVFMPWQLYCYHRFPVEAKFENDFNNRHIWEALEGHEGNGWYYFNNFFDYFGIIGSVLFFSGVLIFIIDNKLNRQTGFHLLLLFSIAFCFFSFVVTTKMIAFFYCVAPIGLVFAAISLNYFFIFFKSKRIIFVGLCLIVLFDSLNPIDLWLRTNYSPERNSKIYNTNIYKQLNNILPPDVKIVINLPFCQQVDLMFYNPSITAYQKLISSTDLKILENKKMKVAAFCNHGEYVLPDYVLIYPYLYVINYQLH